MERRAVESQDRMSTVWLPIESVPRDGTLVHVKCEPHPEFGEHTMWWDPAHKRWAGYAFTVMRRVDTWWDEAAPQPTHWSAVEVS